MSDKKSIGRELDAFLAGEDTEIARIYRRLPQPEPDARIDTAVLAMARGAVEPQRRAAIRHAHGHHRLPAWMIGIGSAAGIVFAAGLAWQLHGTFTARPAEMMRPTRESDEVISVTILPPREPKPASAPAAPEPLAKSAPAPAASAPAPALAVKEAPPETRENFRAKSEVHGVTEYTLPGGSAGRRPQPAPFQVDAQRAAAEQNLGAADADTRAEEEAAQKLRDDAGATAEKKQEFGRRAAPRPEEIERRRGRASLAKDKPAVRQEEAAANAAPPASEASRRDTLLPVNSAALQRNAKLPPARWIEKIRELLAADKRDEAIDNIDYFRAKYPSYALPEDLRRLADAAQ